MMECGHLGPQKNKHNMPHQLIPLTQVIPMQAFLNNCWEIMQLAPLQAKLEIWSCLFQKCYKRLLQLEYSSDIPQMFRSDSGCPTPCDGCGILYCRTPHTQLGWVFRCFPFLLWLKYSLIYCGCPTLHNGRGIFSLLDNLRQFSWVFQCFPFITSHLSFFQIYFHSYLAYLISDSSCTCM